MSDKPLMRYKVQQDKGQYCLKGCDDGDLVDYSRYAFDLAAARELVSQLEGALRWMCNKFGGQMEDGPYDPPPADIEPLIRAALAAGEGE